MPRQKVLEHDGLAVAFLVEGTEAVVSLPLRRIPGASVPDDE